MSRPVVIAALLGLSMMVVGCMGKPAPSGRNEGMPNITMAGPDNAMPASVPSPTSTEAPGPPDPVLIRTGWMKLPAKVLEAHIDRLFRCAAPKKPGEMCGLRAQEGAAIEVLPKEGGHGSFDLLRDWITIDPDDLDARHPERLPRAPFRIVHHLFPHWRLADAWLTYALLHSRRACGRQVHVGNALIFIEIDIGAFNRLVGEIQITPYRPSTERAYLACMRFRAQEGDVDDLATASWTDKVGSRREAQAR